MARLRMRVFALAALAAVTLLGAIEAQAGRWGKTYFGDIEVVDQNGKSHAFYDDLIKGKVFLISFIYTSCEDTCPLITSRLAQLQERLGPAMGRDFFFYSISVDPENDPPKVLKGYAESFGAGPGWLFLTGDPAMIKTLRYKLGDRGRTLDEHRNGVVLGNGATGAFSRDTIFQDISHVEVALHALNRDWAGARRATRDRRTSGKRMLANLASRPGQALYGRLCAGCHTIGEGRKVGPDLAGIAERRDREWLRRFISQPDLMRRQKDPIALSLMKRFPSVRMPEVGVTKNDVDDLLTYIADTELRQARRHPLKSLTGLTTHTGKDFTAEAVKGHPVAVFFGFTHCPDVCPTTLMDWSNVLAELGEDGDELKVLFVTVDPERDTQKSLAEYLGSFDPRIVALTGESKAIKHAARVFEAFHKRIEGKDGGYTFDHTTNVYLVGRDGKLAGTVNLRTPPERRRALIDKVLAQKVAAGR